MTSLLPPAFLLLSTWLLVALTVDSSPQRDDIDGVMTYNHGLVNLTIMRLIINTTYSNQIYLPKLFASHADIQQFLSMILNTITDPDILCTQSLHQDHPRHHGLSGS